MQKFAEIGDSRYIYQNELDIAGFQHDMAYGDFNVAKNVAKNSKYDGYQPGFASLLYKFFDKKSSGGNVSGDALKIKLCQIKN